MNRTLEWIYGSVLCAVVIGGVVYPILARPRGEPGSTCISQLKQCMLAQIMYAADSDEHLPSCTTWMDAIIPYSKNEGIYHCPDLKVAKKDEYGYAMNVAMSRVRTVDINKPELEPALFDSVLLARNACSGFYGFPDPRKRKTVVAYADGHVKSLTEVRK